MHKSCNWITALICFGLIGCAQWRHRAEQPSETGHGEPTAAGRPAPATPKKVAVILGPGGAKALAHAGVLKELAQARIPITEVVGIEWGALVGALYAQRGQVHDMEWKLYKIEKQQLPSRGFFSSQLQAGKVSDLRPYFKDVFGVIAQQGGDVHFSCPSQTVRTGDVRWFDSSSLAASVESCVSLPPLYSAKQAGQVAAVLVDEAIERVRAAGAEVVVMVNVLGRKELFDMAQLPDSGASAILWNDIRRTVWRAKPEVDYWIEVNTDAVSFSDFERRKDAVAAGEKAGQLAARQMIDRYGF